MQYDVLLCEHMHLIRCPYNQKFYIVYFYAAATALEVAAEVLKGNGVTPAIEDFNEKLEKSKKAYFRVLKTGIKDGR